MSEIAALNSWNRDFALVNLIDPIDWSFLFQGEFKNKAFVDSSFIFLKLPIQQRNQNLMRNSPSLLQTNNQLLFNGIQILLRIALLIHLRVFLKLLDLIKHLLHPFKKINMLNIQFLSQLNTKRGSSSPRLGQQKNLQRHLIRVINHILNIRLIWIRRKDI